jgi:hypothetical protein
MNPIQFQNVLHNIDIGGRSGEVEAWRRSVSPAQSEARLRGTLEQLSKRPAGTDTRGGRSRGAGPSCQDRARRAGNQYWTIV